MSQRNFEQAWNVIIRVPETEFNYRSAALVVIDLQYLTASRKFGAFKKLADRGYMDEGEYAISRIESLIVPNVRKVAAAMRALTLPVIFVRCASVRGDGSDQTERHRQQGLVCSINQREAQILDELEVQPTDVVLTKSGSGCFTSTNLDHMLRNMGIRDLILTGMWTNSCVETTARNAGDLDYRVVIVEDACVAMNEKLHHHALEYLDNNFAMIRSTEQVIRSLAG
jgi:nicotinamidase-related amidase